MRAVAVEMVLGEVDQDPDGGIDAGREVDLERGAFDHVDAAHPRRLQRQDRGADIAAELGVVAGALGEMGDQRRRGRLAVGAGDGDERGVGRVAAPLAAEQLDVADDLDGHGAGEADRPMRRRMGERNAGRKHQRRDLRPVELAQVGGRNPRARRVGDAGGTVVPAHHVGAAGEQRAGRDQAGAAEAEHGDFFSRERGDRDHGIELVLRDGGRAGEVHRNFRVESPASASTTAMIQNRITICGSVQPSCSK